MQILNTITLVVALLGAQAQPSQEVKTTEAQGVLKEMSRFIGGVWEAEVKTPDGPFKVEFTFFPHPDGIGIMQQGVIGKGSPKPVHVHAMYGIDSSNGKAYYLDTHNSSTVYFGYVELKDKHFRFTFGPAGGKQDTFKSAGTFVDENTYQSKITQKDGVEVVGLTFKRRKV